MVDNAGSLCKICAASRHDQVCCPPHPHPRPRPPERLAGSRANRRGGGGEPSVRDVCSRLSLCRTWSRVSQIRLVFCYCFCLSCPSFGLFFNHLLILLLVSSQISCSPSFPPPIPSSLTISCLSLALGSFYSAFLTPFRLFI